MNSLNQQKMGALIKYFSENQNGIIYSGIPSACEDIIGNAANLKRKRQYDDSLNAYFAAIGMGYLTTEMGRMMAKTLCAMNEYQMAIIVLLECAKAKWEDTVGLNSMYSAFLSNDAMNAMKQTLPTASANDFYLLRDAIIEAKNGNLSPLFKRTKEVSGQPDYRNEKTDMQIISECKTICDMMRL